MYLPFIGVPELVPTRHVTLHPAEIEANSLLCLLRVAEPLRFVSHLAQTTRRQLVEWEPVNKFEPHSCTRLRPAGGGKKASYRPLSCVWRSCGRARRTAACRCGDRRRR